MELLFLIIGFLAGILATIIWAACYASSKNSRSEETIVAEQFNNFKRERKDNET